MSRRRWVIQTRNGHADQWETVETHHLFSLAWRAYDSLDVLNKRLLRGDKVIHPSTPDGQLPLGGEE